MPWRLATIALALSGCCNEAQSVKLMNPENPYKPRLAQLIRARSTDQAKLLARQMNAEDVGAVLQEVVTTPSTGVQLLALDIASEIPSEGACRAVLGRIGGQDLTIRSVASSLLGTCRQKAVIPDLFATFDQTQDTNLQSAIARQIGVCGDESTIPQLQQRYSHTADTGVRASITAAMARLGDHASRTQIVQKLTAPGVETRVVALHDIEYIGDPKLAAHFALVLEDRQDAVDISPPHDPRVMARVCDVAAGSMTALRLPLPFRALPLRRLSETEIQQALQLVRSMNAPH
jgi:HEAT repeat protein